jgi:hypothetical protein
MFVAATLVAASTLALVHVYVGKLRFLDKNPDLWKSAAGGVGISYAFLVLLPKLGSAQVELQGAADSGLYGFFVHHSYLVALVGLIIYYGMDVAVANVLVLPSSRAWRPAVKLLVFTHAGSLSGYYLLAGYLMSEQEDRGCVSYVSLCLFAAAMILHYLTINHGLRRKFGGMYDRYLRWAFVAASIGGWFLAAIIEIPYTALVLLNSLFAGALIVFTLKEKTPGSDRVHFWPFLAGVTGYSLLLLLIEATVT